MSFPKEVLKYILIIAIPLLLEIIYFWNNDDFYLGIKALEKSTTLLLFPAFIIGNQKYIKFYSLLKAYSVTTTLILLLFLIRYYFEYNQFFLSFYYGMNMWQMGYHFANTIGIHAPALNMHLAFASICNFYFAIFILKNKRFLVKTLHLLLFVISFILLLIINTRIALLVSILGYLLVIISHFLKNKNKLQILKTLSVFIVLISLILVIFIKNNHFMKEKYNRLIFDRFEMIGKLDQIESPEVEIYSSLATRLTIWKTTVDLAKNHLLFGVGSSDSKKELFKYYKQTNQIFLSKYQLPVHNQYLDFLLKFGILGIIGAFLYIGFIGFIGYKLKNVIMITFFLLFFISNLTDDFLIRFDGIVFSGFWISVFTAHYLKTKKENLILL
ncbi:MAG: O-antigen ligase domain-containing protein [Flavobacteriaceae bacterium]|nr:O-antigen ligase domain-containing protein [Flavobacteriaceae bacterium]